MTRFDPSETGIGATEGARALAQQFGAEALDRIAAPLKEASALPNVAYTSQRFFDLENELLFPRGWMLAGFGHQIPNVGDVVPIELAGLPVILLRGEDGQVRGFHNVCRHRGAKLVSAPCSNRRRLVCPYHAWNYDLDGRLCLRPHFHGGDKHDKPNGEEGSFGLVPLRAETWLDFIFVNLSGDAPALQDFLKPMTDRLVGYDLPELRHAGHLTFEVEANWKLVHENFIEPYHVFNVHPRLTKFAPMGIRRPSDFEGRCFYNHYRFPAAEEGRGTGLPYFPNLSDELKHRGMWFHLFPTFDMEIFPDQFTVLHTMPLGPTHTREEIHIYLIGEAATEESYAAARQQVFDMWQDLNDEDLTILEQLQEGRRSPGFDGGRFSPYWDAASHRFAQLVVQEMSRA